MEFKLSEQYTEPDMKLVGDAKEVVLGAFAVGTDMWGETLSFAMEFAEDPAGSIS